MNINNPIPMNFILSNLNNQIIPVEFDIPPWNMLTTRASSPILDFDPHDVVVGIIACIWEDYTYTPQNYFPIPLVTTNPSSVQCSIEMLFGNVIILAREDGGIFEDVLYSDTSHNRGAGVGFIKRKFF